jgi:aminopeptidase YwaD
VRTQMIDNLRRIFTALDSDAQLAQDFAALCDCGGRQAGTPSEREALRFALERLTAIDRSAHAESIEYAGWRCHDATLALEDGTSLTCNALLGAQSTLKEGLTAEVIDLGRGVASDFERFEADIPGRIVLVRHEYPFSTEHVHRRRKYNWALERGAVGFIIANAAPGAGPVAGSSGRDGRAGIPAVGTDYESALALRPLGSRLPRVHLALSAEDYAAQTDVLEIELGPARARAVVLSAHLDGHSLAESAMDNATGVAVALAVTRALAPFIAECGRSLKLCLFSAEEWALAGSREYLERMTPEARDRIAINVNLDTVGGDDHLTALTSEFPALDAFVLTAAASAEIELATYRPLMQNSDHYNFAHWGIPALRLVAGFNRPTANVRHILTAADTRDKVAFPQLLTAAKLTAALLWQALTASDAQMTLLRDRA